MKVLKTVFAVALCAMFSFVFAACSAGESSESASPEEMTDTVEETGTGEQTEVIASETVNAETTANTEASEDAAAEPHQTNPVTQQYAGIVKEITKEDGLYSYTITINDGTSESEIVAAQNENTIIVDAAEGTPIKPEDIKEGEVVEVYLSMMTTRSIPPISQAYCIIGNLPADNMGVAAYVEVTEAKITDGGDLVVLNQNADLYVTVPKDVEIGISGEDGEKVPFDQITEGTKLLCWFDAVMESYPAQATAYMCQMCV